MNDGTHMLVSVPPFVLSPSSDTSGGMVQQSIAIRVETTQSLCDGLDIVCYSVQHAPCCHNHMKYSSIGWTTRKPWRMSRIRRPCNYSALEPPLRCKVIQNVGLLKEYYRLRSIVLLKLIF
jgi:hypothetical protein